jgi:hypothetical protein
MERVAVTPQERGRLLAVEAQVRALYAALVVMGILPEPGKDLAPIIPLRRVP